MSEETRLGVVTSVDASGAWVDAEGERLFCRIRGRFYEDLGNEKRPVAPGDRIRYSATAPGEGVIEEIEPRTTRLSRPSGPYGDQEQVMAANVDQVAIVVATRSPRLSPGLIDRIIVAATNQQLTPFVVVNKIDLGRRKIAGELRTTFTELGYRVILTSATGGEAVEEFHEQLKGHVTIIAGHSGVGKSSLMNRVDPSLKLRVGAISRASGKGKHTTTRAELMPVPGGGYVVDTPGIRSFGLWDLEPADLDIFFVEFQPLIEECRFHNCSHSHEPDCAVVAAVARGEVEGPRYRAYLRILESMMEE
jgi:ribosome biogenesis GTPase / thiamine phosphate phosphatase